MPKRCLQVFITVGLFNGGKNFNRRYTKMRKTKILATIGPASWDKPILKEMIRQGLDGCRINFSHTPEEQAKRIVDNARSISEEL